MSEKSVTPTALSQIPRGVWALGFVSMFMDISSEMIHALLPIYLVSVLGASMVSKRPTNDRCRSLSLSA
jgi:hypothetical protein